MPTNSRTVLRRNVVINTISVIVPLFVAAFSIPRVIGSIGTSRFGILSLCWVIIGYSGLFDLGLGRALTKFVAERLGTKREEELPPLIWTASLLMALLGSVGGVLCALSGPLVLFHWIHVPAELRKETLDSIYIVAVSLPVVVVTAGLRGVLEAAQRFDMSGSLKAALGVYNFLSPVLVLPFSVKLPIILLVLVAGRVVVLFAHWILCRRIVPALRLNSQLSVDLIGPLFKFGTSSTVSSATAPLMAALDRFVVGAQVSVAAVSFYASPYEITSRLSLFPNALAGVLFPAFSATSTCGDVQTSELFKRAARSVMVIMLPSAFALVAFAHVGLQFWLGPEFAMKSTLVLQLLAIGVFTNSFGLLAFSLVQGIGRPDLCAKLNVLEFPFYASALWSATSAYGIAGAAAVALARNVCDTAVLLLFSARVNTLLRKPVFETFVMMFFGLIALASGVIPKLRPVMPHLFVAGLVVCGVFAWRYVLAHDDRKNMLGYCRKLVIPNGSEI
jgi:O-antigen/teichoic acid export membrane protein